MTKVHVGWVERSETHHFGGPPSFGGFRFRSTHPTYMFVFKILKYLCITMCAGAWEREVLSLGKMLSYMIYIIFWSHPITTELFMLKNAKIV
jgi:hypothetical protein